MELEITKKTEFPMVGRTQVECGVKFDAATPKLDDLRNAIGQKLKVEAGLVVINHVYSGYGSRTATVHAYAYKDAMSKGMFTVIAKKKRKADAKAKYDASRKAFADKKEAAAKAAEESAKAAPAA